jgi:putative nucleotidyltransferase with HDIG domain
MKMKILSKIRDLHDELYKLTLIFLSVLTIVYFLPRESTFKYEYQLNKPWYYDDLIAPYDIPVFPTQNEILTIQKEIKLNSKAYYNFEPSVINQQILKFNDLLNKKQKILNDDQFIWIKNNGEKILDHLYKRGVLETPENFKIKKLDNFFVKKNNFYASYSYSDVYTLKEAFQYIDDQLSKKNANNELLIEILQEVLSENAFNLIFNPTETNLALQKELQVSAGVVDNLVRGQSVIKKGDIVDDFKFRLLQSFEKKYKSEKLSSIKYLTIAFGHFLLVALIFTSLCLYLIFFRIELFKNNKTLFFILLSVTFTVSLASFSLKHNLISIHILPLCLTPLVIRSFFDTRTAFFSHIMVVLLLGFIMPNSFNFLFMQIVAGMVGIYGYINFKNRSQLFYTTIAILASYFVGFVGISIITDGDFTSIDWAVFGEYSIAAGLTILAYPLIYIIEKLFGFVSDITLLELADTNNKLLRELSRKAPGTFQHSLQVANLAEEAIHLINGNALLIRTAALYHDIGKMNSPMYFIENQITGVNPHNELDYEESARIIINHVVDGVEIAKKHKLPETIIDFIRTHHGTTSTKYFYKKYVEDTPEDKDTLKKFQYPGPIPFSKETAVLMMADSVEAASRSIKEPTAEKIEELVEKIIQAQMEEGQFSNANITLKDISIIKKVFKRMLMNIYHVRIEYPK